VKRVLLVGAGGIGAPAGLALAAAGVHVSAQSSERVIPVRTYKFAFDPAVIALKKDEPVILEWARASDVVVDATDNFASRFLLADACHLASVPVVHAAAVRTHATVLTVGPLGAPCYRCVFEDLPEGPAPDCATAGVLGPVCGVAGAVAADRALALLAGKGVAGDLVTYEGPADRLRRLRVRGRSDCALCGEAPLIRAIEAERYARPSCGLD